MIAKRRRETGALENEVMAYLWATGGPATPSDVHMAVAPDLAYTTVMTVLTRLWEKDQLVRAAKGRGYAYSPVRSEAEHRADLMQSTLTDSGNREAVLSSFVAALDPTEIDVLRKLIGDDKP